jgi:flagellar protein FlaG
MREKVSSHQISFTSRTITDSNLKDIAKENNINNLEQPKLKIQTQKDKEKLEDIVTGLNEFLQPSYTSLKFELHDKLNEYYVTVIDDKTQEVVKEIPSKKLLDLYAAMTEFVGLVVDKKI